MSSRDLHGDTSDEWRREIDGERRRVERREWPAGTADGNSLNRRLREVEQQQIAMAAQQRAMAEAAEKRDKRLDKMETKLDSIAREIGSAHAFLRHVAWIGGAAVAVWAFIGDWIKRQLVGT